jgi:outer membrane protein assembly factor BamB
MRAFFWVALPVAVLAGDWTRFRGPNGSGVAETAIPAEFGPERNVVWKIALPPGHSSPVLSGDSVFVTAYEGADLLTLCLDRATGREKWRRAAPRPRKETYDKRNSPASASPVLDAEAVYVFFGDFGLLSYDLRGRERWRLPLGPFDNIYGMGASPVLAGNSVVLICDQSRGSFAVGVDKKTGQEKWRRPRPEALSGHATPAVVGKLVIAPASFRVDAYDADSGEIVWYAKGLASEMKSVPVVVGDTVYISGYNTPENDPGKQVKIPDFAEMIAKYDTDNDGKLTKDEVPDAKTKAYFPYQDLDGDGKLDAAEWKGYQAVMAAENGLLAFRLGGQGDQTTKGLRWKYQRSVPQLPSVLHYRGVLYMLNDSGVLTTLDPATGQAHKTARLRGAADSYYASPVAADGKIVFVSRTGKLTVLEAGAEQKQLSTAELDDEVFATPAIADGRLYLRTRAALYCFGAK